MKTITALLTAIKPYLPLLLLVGAGYILVENFDTRQGDYDPKRSLRQVSDSDLPLLDRGNGQTGAQSRLTDWTGKPLLINFWASWCQVCRLEKPLLQQLAKNHPEANLVSVVTYDELEAIRSSGELQKRPFPTLFDYDGDLARESQVESLPHTLLVDKSGYIRKRYRGALTPQRVLEIGDWMQKLAQEDADSSPESAE